jgi:hypothetical protein
MGRIPLDLSRPVSQPKITPYDVGMGKAKAKVAVAGAQAQRGQVIAQGIGQVGGAVLDVLKQRRDSDIRADEATYDAFSRNRMGTGRYRGFPSR